VWYVSTTQCQSVRSKTNQLHSKIHRDFIKKKNLLPAEQNHLFSFLYINTATCFGLSYSTDNRRFVCMFDWQKELSSIKLVLASQRDVFSVRWELNRYILLVVKLMIQRLIKISYVSSIIIIIIQISTIFLPYMTHKFQQKSLKNQHHLH
jgi:hypothetical protein